MTADRWGIDEGYEDSLGTWRPTRPGTRSAILAAMGVDRQEEAAETAVEPITVIREGETPVIEERAELILEDGTRLAISDRLPHDLPLGYHTLAFTHSRTRALIVSPARCVTPPAGSWGWAVQLYAARSHESWGIGDFNDLARLGRWSSGVGGRILVVNPLHPTVPREPEDPSPYAPSSRRYLNPLYLRIEDVPGAGGAALDRLQQAGRALNADRRIDRGAVARLKSEALAELWRRFGGDADFDRFVRDEGSALETFATFCALAEHHRAPWHTWPEAYRRPDAPAVARFATDHRDRVRFHQWMQWLLDRQLARAALEATIVHDFPIGVDPDGADAWAWQDVLATQASVGAPPDRFNRRGQDWGLPPFVPHRLRSRRYEPIVHTLRAAFRHGGGVRIDHVMGMFRQFWVPRGLTPSKGAYVRYHADELLAIIALESQRAGAFVIGEDLGTVERGVRERLTASGVLSTRVLWFESDPPERWPELALAAATTHDLPTIAGVWSGHDAAAQHELGIESNVEAIADTRRRLAALARVPDDASVERVIEATYRALAAVPSLVVTATLEDAFAVEERPNMPGTRADQRPNWSLALPHGIEALEHAPLARAIVDAMRSRRRERRIFA